MNKCGSRKASYRVGKIKTIIMLKLKINVLIFMLGIVACTKVATKKQTSFIKMEESIKAPLVSISNIDSECELKGPVAFVNVTWASNYPDLSIEVYECGSSLLIESYNVLNNIGEFEVKIGYPADGSKPNCSFLHEDVCYEIRLIDNINNVEKDSDMFYSDDDCPCDMHPC